MLETLGLDASAELIYRSLLRHPDDGVAAHAERLGLPEELVRRGLDELSELALVRPSSRVASGFRPVAPEAAMEALLTRQQAELAAQQLRVERSRAAAARLIAECAALRPRAVGVETHRLDGPEEIREHLAQLARQTTEEICTFAPGGGHSEEDLRASREPNADLLSRGVRMRTVYLDSVRNHAPTMEHIDRLLANGGHVRTAPTLPVRMIISDRSSAVLPIDTEDALLGAVVLSGSGTVTALCALFETVWSTAVPVGKPAEADATGLSRQERTVLTLLAEGHTDEAIAKRLGVSPRTARRLAADLMERFGARSRFQAGVVASAQGWLTPER